MSDFKGLRGDQRFIPGFAFNDGNMRVLEGDVWYIVDDETGKIRVDPEAPDAPNP